jgi:ribosomal protein L2
VSFVGGFVINPYTSLVTSTVFLGSGEVSSVPSVECHKVLALIQLRSIFQKKSEAYTLILSIIKNLEIPQGFFLVIQLPKHSQVSNIEVQPKTLSTIARSPGSSAKIVKTDPRTGLSLVKIPSGVKKNSIYFFSRIFRQILIVRYKQP